MAKFHPNQFILVQFQLRKQAGVIKDTSRATVKLAILGSGEIFGLEECSVKPTSTKVKNRSYSVVCQENGAKVIFISHQMFAEKVLCDPIVDRAIKLDCKHNFNRGILESQLLYPKKT